MEAGALLHSCSADRALFFAIGLVSCGVGIWLHRAFANLLFGSGILAGQAKTPGFGHYVTTSRGRVHYVYLDKPASEPGTGQASASSDARTLEQPLVESQRRLGQKLEYGGIHGELVVIVHGFGGSNDAFVSRDRADYASWLNQHGFAVLAFDLYGFGHSDGPDTHYTTELFVEQLAELCLIFGITRPFDLLGFSMGGSVALQFAHRYDHLVKRLILQAPHITEAPLRPSLQVALRIPFFRELLGCCIIPNIGECANNRAALRASFRLLIARLRGGGRWSAPGKGGSTREVLHEIDRRGRVVYVLWGRKDTVVHWHQTRCVLELAPHCKLVTHPTANHMTFADGPEPVREFFREALLGFLNDPVPAEC